MQSKSGQTLIQWKNHENYIFETENLASEERCDHTRKFPRIPGENCTLILEVLPLRVL